MTYQASINDQAKANDYFRKVLVTGKHAQVVVMALQPNEDIGMEVHDVDQILVFVEGQGKSILDGQEAMLAVGDLVYVPAGTQHNFINVGPTVMKLYTVYAPAEHRDGTVHKTKAEAQADETDEPA